MQLYHPFSLALGLLMLAVSALLVWGSLWNLRHPQSEIRWWWPLGMGLMALGMGLGRVSAALDPGATSLPALWRSAG
jgi:hypothetical protein